MIMKEEITLNFIYRDMPGLICNMLDMDSEVIDSLCVYVPVQLLL